MGLRLSDEIAPDMYNYGQLQVVFEDGSVGWYEAGWGPMMSETAFFVKDVVSPNGSVSITDGDKGSSDDVDGHTKVGGLLVHRRDGDTLIDLPDEPGHQDLCDAEQAYMIRAITEQHRPCASHGRRGAIAAHMSCGRSTASAPAPSVDLGDLT